MQKLFPMYGIMSAELKFRPKEQLRTENYDTTYHDLTRMRCVEVAIAICDTHRWRAHGKIWTFKINTGANNISLVMLPELLTKMGAISNASLTWTSLELALFLYLVNTCTTTSLPDKRYQFNTLCSRLFPKLSIVLAGPKKKSQI